MGPSLAQHFRMHTFKVVREPYGWAIRVGEGMSAPFRSREIAVQEAQCLCDALRRHGELAQVTVEPIEPPSVALAEPRSIAYWRGTDPRRA